MQQLSVSTAYTKIGCMAGIALLLLSGCASTVKPLYVSPTQYQAMSCANLHAEYERISHYIHNGVSAQKSRGVGVGVGLGGGWGSGRGWGLFPTISLNVGQSSNTKNTELARVLGEQEAVAQAAKFKNCPIQTQ